MSYFSHFPTTGYILDEQTAKVVKAKNILIRAKFSEYVKTNEALLIPYKIREEDRPDTIANTVYGRPDLHWVVLLFNEIINPYHDWPKTQQQLEEFMMLEYPGVTLYLRDDSIKYKFAGDYRRIAPDMPLFEPGTKIYQYNTIYNCYVSGVVRQYNPSLGQLVLDQLQWEQPDSVPNEPGETVLPVPADPPAFNAIVQLPGGAIALGATIFHTNEMGNYITAEVTKIELTPYAVHHFEDSDGNILDPIGKFIPVNASATTEYRPYIKVSKSLMNLYADPSLNDNGEVIGETLTVNQKVVTNIDHEYKQNENLRQIKILKPTFLDEVLKQFGNLFRV